MDLLSASPNNFNDDKLIASCRHCRGNNIYLTKNGVIYCEDCHCPDCGGYLDENDECQWLNAFLGKYEDWENKSILSEE